jgi:lysozyme
MRTQQIIIIGAGLAAVGLWMRQQQSGTEEETVFDTIGQTMDQALGMLAPGPAADMYPSEELRAMLKGREALRLERYNLGDGGWTIGYGHFERDINKIPARITPDDAEAMFDSDLYARGYKWVRLYVSVPVNQYQFDALTHIAYNLSPKGFKRFADAVNAGEGIDAIADASVYWPAPQFQNGIRARRATEVALFNDGVYA